MELMQYIDPPDIPPGMTIQEWRVRRHAARERERPRLTRRLGRWFPAVTGRRPATPLAELTPARFLPEITAPFRAR